ncbi:MAG: hypothetical protein Q7S40_04185 [Opitutaceae bacterium]|nr:hypothetical protein [Opitutaceae bacterium]
MSDFCLLPFLVRCGFLAAGLFAGGCTSVYKVRVEAMARPNSVSPGRASYRIEDQSAVPAAGVLRHQEIANQIRTALSAQGLYEAPDAQAADMVVEISYGIGPPHAQRTVYEELAFGRPMTAAERRGPPPEGVAREMMGYTALAETIVLREKHLSICARENHAQAEEKPAEDLWRVDVMIEDESDDLRGHLPVLASAAMDHIGRTTNGATAVTLRSDDDAIRFIRRGL